VHTNSGDEAPNLTVLESVRCLECGAVYAKPSGGGTVHQNPGCPECGYVGWANTTMRPFNESWLPRRSDAGRLRHRSG
jgi:phage FluMu protein Com